MTARRLAVYVAAGALVVMAILGFARWQAARAAIRDEEYRRNEEGYAEALRVSEARRAALTRQLAAATASVDSAETRYQRSEALRRRLVLVPRTPGVADTVIIHAPSDTAAR